MSVKVRSTGVISRSPLLAECTSSLLADELGARQGLVGTDFEGLHATARGLQLDLVIAFDDVAEAEFASFAGRAADRWPYAWVVAGLQLPSSARVHRALSMGYVGCISGAGEAAHIVNDLAAILAGRSQGWSAADSDRAGRRAAGRRGRSASARLTERETTVLRQLALGLSSRDSADVLGLSSRTIDTHRRRISAKLGLDSVAELTKHCIAEGLIDLQEDEPLSGAVPEALALV